jgi:hypothetical protein
MQPSGRNGFFAHLGLAARIAIVAGPGALEAQEAVYSVDEVKAPFLYHFGTYIEWPTEDPTDQTIALAVLGAPTVVAPREAFLPGRRIQGRHVAVRPLAAIDDLADTAALQRIGRSG